MRAVRDEDRDEENESDKGKIALVPHNPKHAQNHRILPLNRERAIIRYCIILYHIFTVQLFI